MSSSLDIRARFWGEIYDAITVFFDEIKLNNFLNHFCMARRSHLRYRFYCILTECDESRLLMPPSKYLKLAQKILDVAMDLDLHQGDRLVEKTLADSCSVSRTPVRSALRLLEKEGMARKAAEGGFVLECEPEKGHSILNQHAVRAGVDLAGAILRDRGARRLDGAINVTDLIRRYSVSRSAAQRALEALLAQGVIQKAEGQSWVFTRMPGDRSGRIESYEFRLILEPQAILSDGFKLDTKRADLVRSQTEALLAQSENSFNSQDFQNADLAFHKLIARSSGNQYLASALMAHHGLRHLPGGSFGMIDFRMRQALDEHLRILDFIEQDHFDLAADQMRVHLRLSMHQRPSVANRGAPALVQATRGSIR